MPRSKPNPLLAGTGGLSSRWGGAIADRAMRMYDDPMAVLADLLAQTYGYESPGQMQLDENFRMRRPEGLPVGMGAIGTIGKNAAAVIPELENLVRFTERPSRPVVQPPGGRTTVKNPTRKAYPDIYRRPDVIVSESAAQVGKEDPLLRQLFGVSRQDIDEIAKERYRSGATLQDQPVWVPPKGGPGYVQNLFTPANTRRVQDIVGLAATDPKFAGNWGWYETDPLYQMFKDLLGQEAGKREYDLFHIIGSAFSPGSPVPQEIRRASIANMMRRQGLGAKFLEPNGPPPLAGHIYHTSSHQAARPVLEGGIFDPSLKSAPKVSKYLNARLGTNMDYPVGDAHYGRLIGLPDVRTAKAGVGGSPSAAEYYLMQEWYRNEIANKLGIPSVPAQAIQWNAGGLSTGLKTGAGGDEDFGLGAPLLELIAKSVGNQAARTGEKPMDVLQKFILGTGHLW